MADWGKSWLRFSGIERLASPGKYLHRLIWLGCISVCIPVMLAGMAYYQFSLNRMNSYLQAENGSSLNNLKDRAERVLQEIEQESLQLAKDPVIQAGLTGPEDPYGLQSFEMLKRIELAKNSNSFIDDIFLYEGEESRVLSNEYGASDISDYAYRDNIRQLLESGHPAQWVQFANRKGHLTFVRRLPLIGTKGPEGVLGFEIETAALSQFLETDTAVLTDGDDLMIVKLYDPFAIEQRPDADAEIEAAELKGLNRIRTAQKSSGYFAAEGEGGKPAQYWYVKNVFGRTYVSVIPEQYIARQLNWIRKMTASILAAVAGIGLFLAYLTSKRAYTPIDQLIRYSRSISRSGLDHKRNELDIIKESLDYLSAETGKLEAYMQNIEPTLREKFLGQLLGGDYARKETLIHDCGVYGIEAEYTNVALIVEAENMFTEKRFLPEEKGIVAFALANVMQEVLSNLSLDGYAIPYQGRGAALLQFKPDVAQETSLSRTLEYASAIAQAFRDVLDFEVTVGIGRFYSHIADVPVSFKEAETALHYRIFRDSEQVLYIEDVEHVKKMTQFGYPRELEASIVEALDQEDIPAAVRYFRSFADVLQQSHSVVYTYQSYHILLSAMIVSMERQGASSADMMEHNLFGQLRTKTTAKEIRAWFEETLFPLYAWLTRKDRETSGESAIHTVCSYIRDNCGSDLSLVRCAEIIGVSPSYLSRLFKKKLGKNFLEYVAECKIAEAKRLLKETDRSVSEVAAAVGYSERNFIRIFQRYAASTPGSYRSQHR
ncbi:helix-turn-helix domain-containing protein [Paenibacillus humicola]|uniref:helix-turn-helix domain-containing protein n=1 Tax=Paenibacillus humicola TaxID=3110540 RepID=UPI00237B674A|nr:helix-turn-helix domain-containing protein [Paenibacillus humicola]